MAVQFHVFGPTTVEVDGVEVGQSDGQILISIDEVRPHEPVTTDAAGGQPDDFITQQAHGLVGITFIEWDEAILSPVLAGMLANSTVGSPQPAPRGESGDVGMLRRRDGGMHEVTIRGSKATARDGGLVVTFPLAMQDPNTPSRKVNIGSKASAMMTSLYCLPDDDGAIYVEEVIPNP